jgi:hypothetical protein
VARKRKGAIENPGSTLCLQVNDRQLSCNYLISLEDRAGFDIAASYSVEQPKLSFLVNPYTLHRAPKPLFNPITAKADPAEA